MQPRRIFTGRSSASLTRSITLPSRFDRDFTTQPAFFGTPQQRSHYLFLQRNCCSHSELNDKSVFGSHFSPCWCGQFIRSRARPWLMFPVGPTCWLRPLVFSVCICSFLACAQSAGADYSFSSA